jgi:hypothetical protein
VTTFLYGEPTSQVGVKRAGVSNDCLAFTAYFTTAGGSNPTIDAQKTRGVISIARTGTGVITITLPYKLYNVNAQVSVASYPAGAIAHVPTVQNTEATKVVTITTVTLAGNAAADTTNLVLSVRIEGRAK